MATLDRIEIHGFKSIREMSLRLEPLNILIGANGAGKSNFISAFGLLNKIVENQLQIQVQKWGGAGAILHRGRRETPEMLVRLHFGSNGYETRLAAADDDSLFFAEEQCWYDYQNPPKRYLVELGVGHKETRLHQEAKQRPGRIAYHALAALRGWKVYHFHDTSSEAGVKRTGDIDDSIPFRADASNLAAFLYFLKMRHEEHYRQIVNTVRLAAPFFRDFNLRPNPANPEKIRLEWLEKDSDAYFNAHALSDGTLRFICLATLLLQPDPPSMVLIDEPELGLHPYAISLLAGLLKSAALETQAIVSTQSVTLVNQFLPENVIVVDRVDGQSTFRRLESHQMETWLEDYGLGDLWEKNVIGGRPR